MRRQLPTLNIASPCHEPTENMRDVEGGRHCFACNKKVFDLTQMTADEAEALFMASGQDLCGEVRMKPSGVPAFRSRTLMAAGVAASLMAQGCGSLPAAPSGALSTPTVSMVSGAKDDHIRRAALDPEAAEAAPSEPQVAPDQAAVDDTAPENIAPEQPTELSDEDAGDAPDAGPQQPRQPQYPIARGRMMMHPNHRP